MATETTEGRVSKREQQIIDSIHAEGPLAWRLEKCREMIGRMCAEGRPPNMSIPVQWYDEDVFISQTLKDAIEALVEPADTLQTLQQEG